MFFYRFQQLRGSSSVIKCPENQRKHYDMANHNRHDIQVIINQSDLETRTCSRQQGRRDANEQVFCFYF